mmetsp:Transcript_8271/g.25944  ORF Transcript_8271/g.25944 Transcript_8271/m.25944 type:complete len:185 (+) Transcript_8271:214-768(+)
MSKLAFDYSKWDNIEISDDEADTHPNIDKASWFRMKHRSRVEREETEKMEKTAMEKENKADSEREREIVRLLAEVRSGGDAAEYEDEDALVGELEEARAGVASNVASRRWRMGGVATAARRRRVESVASTACHATRHTPSPRRGESRRRRGTLTNRERRSAAASRTGSTRSTSWRRTRSGTSTT